MIVCVCHSISDRQIRQAAEQGVRSLQELQKALPVATCCGKCGNCARRIIDRQNADDHWLASAPSPEPMPMPAC